MIPRRDAVIATLRQRFLSASHLGLLAPGDKLPSVRDLARELGVDRRVVLAAYRALEREGVAELRQRSGMYFAPAAANTGRGPRNRADPQAAERHAERHVERQTEWLADVAAEAVARGTPLPALADAVDRHLRTLRLRAACVECNDDQIAALCAALGADYGFEAAGVALDPLRDVTALFDAPLPDALRRADLLVTTPFHAGDVKLVAERLGKPWIAVALRADVFAELARLLDHGPAYAVVADPRFAYKLSLIYRRDRAGAGGGPFRALVVGRDDLGTIPAGAPTLVTGLARERMAGAGAVAPAVPGGVHAIAEPRAFAPASARELTLFLVRANAAALAGRAAG